MSSNRSEKEIRKPLSPSLPDTIQARLDLQTISVQEAEREIKTFAEQLCQLANSKDAAAIQAILAELQMKLQGTDSTSSDFYGEAANLLGFYKEIKNNFSFFTYSLLSHSSHGARQHLVLTGQGWEIISGATGNKENGVNRTPVDVSNAENVYDLLCSYGFTEILTPSAIGAMFRMWADFVVNMTSIHAREVKRVYESLVAKYGKATIDQYLTNMSALRAIVAPEKEK